MIHLWLHYKSRAESPAKLRFNRNCNVKDCWQMLFHMRVSTDRWCLFNLLRLSFRFYAVTLQKPNKILALRKLISRMQYNAWSSKSLRIEAFHSDTNNGSINMAVRIKLFWRKKIYVHLNNIVILKLNPSISNMSLTYYNAYSELWIRESLPQKNSLICTNANSVLRNTRMHFLYKLWDRTSYIKTTFYVLLTVHLELYLYNKPKC
jgi:hypothetical protein